MERQILFSLVSTSGRRLAARGFPQVSQVEKLHKAGKTDAAARLLKQEFRGLVRQQLNLSATGAERQQLDEFKSRVQAIDKEEDVSKLFSRGENVTNDIARLAGTKEKLEAELMMLLEPGETTSARKLEAWAIAQEVFGDKDVAAKTYQKLLEAHPQNNAARLQYIFLDATHASQRFTLLFPKVNKRFRRKFLSGVIGRMATGLADDDMLSLAESVVDYKNAKNGDSIDDASLHKLLEALTSHDSILTKSSHWKPIYARVTEEEAKREKASRGYLDILFKRRRRLHDRIALTLTDSSDPGLATEGFTAYLASAEAAGKPIDEHIVTLALKTVYAAKNSRANSRANSRNWNSGGVFFGNKTLISGRGMFHGATEIDQSRLVTKRTPVEFLGRHYGLSEVADDEQVELIAKKLESLRAKAEAHQLRSTYRLCRASDDEFNGIAKNFIKTAKVNSRRANRTEWRKALLTVIEIWKTRNLDADISRLVIDYSVNRPRSYSSYNGIPHLPADEVLADYLRQLIKVREISEVQQFLTQFRLEMIGSEQKQRELATLLTDKTTIQNHKQKLSPAGTYYLLAQTLQSPKTAWLSVKEMQRFPFPGQSATPHYRTIMDAMSAFDLKEDSVLEWLGRAGVLGDLSDFDPFYDMGNETRDSTWGHVLKRLRYKSVRSFSTEVAKKLSQKTEKTFGEKLLLSFAEGKTADIYQLLGEELDVFNELPLERQRELARFASEMNDIRLFHNSKAADAPPSKESRAAKEKCLQVQAEAIESKRKDAPNKR